MSLIDQSGLVGKIRDRPISPELEAVLKNAADEAGVDTVFVVSGGQPGTAGKRTGSTRHDGGRAADLQLRKNGKTLQFTDDQADPTVEAFVTAAAKNGATGMGAGVKYRGPQTLHIGFGTSPADHSRIVWGAGGHAANAPAWLEAAADKGWRDLVEPPATNFTAGAASGLPAAALLLLDFIGPLESGSSGYESVFGNRQRLLGRKLTSMTLDEVLGFQTQLLQLGSRSTAVGRYQFLQKTLVKLKNDLGIAGSTLFGSMLQDRLGFQKLSERGFQDFLQQRLSRDQFALQLAMEWASLPVLHTVAARAGQKLRGQSFYESDLNHALVSPERFEAALNDALTMAQRGSQQAGKGSFMPNPSVASPVTLPGSDVSKPWYLSKGVIGSLVAIGLPIISIFFPPAKLANPDTVTFLITQIIETAGPIIGGLVALLGRIQARQPIAGTAAAKAAQQQAVATAPGLDILGLPFLQVITQLPQIVAGLQQMHAATGSLGGLLGIFAPQSGGPQISLSNEADGDRADAGLAEN